MLSGYLNKDQVYEMVMENQYSYPEYKYRGRCFSGEFKNSFHLPALSLPGGDLGELAILQSTALTFGFEIDMNKATEVLFQLTCGNEHLTSLSAKDELATCDYFRHLAANIASYNLDKPSLDMLYKLYATLLPDFNIPSDRSHSHEHAVIIFESSQGLYPQYTFESYEGTYESHLLIFHKTLVDLRHRELAKKFVDKKIVELYGGLDVDYLYEVLSDTTEVHLYETVRRIDTKLPIFTVSVDEKQKIIVNQL